MGAPGGFHQQRCLPRPGQHGTFAHCRFRAEAGEIEQMRMDLLRVQFDEQRRQRDAESVLHPHRRQTARRAEAVAGGRHPASRRCLRSLSAGGIRRRSCGKSTRTRGRTSTRTRPSSSAARSSRRDCEGCSKVLCCDWQGQAAIPSLSCRRTSAAARPIRKWRCTTRFRARPPAKCPVSRNWSRKRASRLPQRQAGGPCRHEDFSGPTAQEAGWHGRPHALG